MRGDAKPDRQGSNPRTNGTAFVVEMLIQHPLTANAVNRLQTKVQQQLLWRNRGPTALGIQLVEGGVEPIKRLIRKPPHLPQGMGCGDAVFCGDVREQGTNAFLLNAHTPSAIGPFSRSQMALSAAY